MTYTSVRIEKLTPHIGAEVHGVDLSRPLDERTFKEVHAALIDNGVIFFRDQRLTPEEQKGFGRLFGDLHVHPAAPSLLEGHPEILVIHADETSKRVAGEVWHSDVSCDLEPPLGSILYMHELPPVGGDTLFASMYAAYDGLSGPMKRFVEGLTAWHDGEHVYRGRYGVKDEGKTFPKAEHPLVRTHPVSGRKGLFVNRGFTTRIAQLSRPESDALLELLYQHIETPEFHCRFRWQVNSVAFWDNRCVQHHAMWDYFPQRRHGHRVTIRGDKPFFPGLSMDFEYSDNQQAFRLELREWLTRNLPADLCLDDPADDRVASDRETFERRRVWQKTMHAAGWVGIAWPKDYGGRGASLIERVIWDEEYAAARAPVLPGAMGLNLVGPTIIHWGTDEQRKRYLPPIMSGEEVWAQGFSEPGAGSDLASLRTRAEDRGDHFVLNGQKVWTSGAHFAHWILVLARTNPDAPKHKGISAFLVPLSTKGITVRPLVLLTGHRHFNEVFFEDVVVPRENLLGPVDQGWTVSTTTLMYERHSTGARNPIGQVKSLIAVARRLQADGRPAWDDPIVRQRLSQLAIDCEAMRLTRMRSLTRQLRGEPPGPEGSVLKVFGSELGLRIAEAAGELLGMHALVNQGSETVPDAPRWYNRVLAARQYTISAGTSEIQRNIIGERVLGLPKG